jgi:hypothetical protein
MISTPEQPRRDDWTAPLRTRFPMAISAGFECFQGWQPIVIRMLERLEAMVAQQPAAFRRGLKVEGIRQKFGALSIYLSKVRSRGKVGFGAQLNQDVGQTAPLHWNPRTPRCGPS